MTNRTRTAGLYTVRVWNDEEADWLRTRRFRTLDTAVRIADAEGGRAQVIGDGGRILHGTATTDRCPRWAR